MEDIRPNFVRNVELLIMRTTVLICVKKWENVNLHETEYDINFDTAFSNDIDELRKISGCLNCIWNLENWQK